MVDIIAPLVCTAIKPGYATAYFSRPLDLKTGTLKNRLLAVRPTIFLGVPRVWEKFMEGARSLHFSRAFSSADCRCRYAGGWQADARWSQKEARGVGQENHAGVRESHSFAAFL